VPFTPCRTPLIGQGPLAGSSLGATAALPAAHLQWYFDTVKHVSIPQHSTVQHAQKLACGKLTAALAMCWVKHIERVRRKLASRNAFT